MDRLIKGLPCDVATYFEAHHKEMPDTPVRNVSASLYTSVSAVLGTIYQLCKAPEPCSSQVVGALLRILLDSSVSVFAFCHDPDKRAVLFLDFEAILKLRGQRRINANVGCPFFPRHKRDEQECRAFEEDTRLAVCRVGRPFLKKKAKNGQSEDDLLREAVCPGSNLGAYFHDHWYPEKNREEVLRYEKMEWLDDVMYDWLCSAVHSDVGAARVFAGYDRTNTVRIASWFWGASVWRLVQILGVPLPQNLADRLRDECYVPMQWQRQPAGST